MFFTNSIIFLKNYFSLFFFFPQLKQNYESLLQMFCRYVLVLLCSYVFWMYIEVGLVLVETDFSLPKFPPGTLLALTALCHGSWSWSILDSVCISAWQHGGTIKLCPWSSSVLLYGENTHEGCFWHRPLQNNTSQELLTQIVSWIWSIFRIKHLKPNPKNRNGEPWHYLDYVRMIETRKWAPKTWPNWEVNKCSAPQMLHHWQAAGGNRSCVWWTKAAVFTWCLKAASGENLD